MSRYLSITRNKINRELYCVGLTAKKTSCIGGNIKFAVSTFKVIVKTPYKKTITVFGKLLKMSGVLYHEKIGICNILISPIADRPKHYTIQFDVYLFSKNASDRANLRTMLFANKETYKVSYPDHWRAF